MTDEINSAIAEIGPCEICKKSARLDGLICATCASIWGPKGGVVTKRVRSNPEFAALVYGFMQDDLKEKFIKMFGLPEGCRAPEKKPELDPRRRFRVVNGGLLKAPKD